MAAGNCTECNGKVSSISKMCPHCGHPMTLGRRSLENAKDTIGSVWSFTMIGLTILIVMASCEAIFGG